MELNPISHYAHQLRPGLPDSAFKPVHARLVWLPVHLAVIVLATLLVAAGWGGWPVALLLVPLIGHSLAGLTFLGHETLHGSVVRNRSLKYVIGWIGFLPFVISPRFWITWHNKVHHGHTGKTGVDPDAYPTVDQYRESLFVRVVTNHLSLGPRRWAGVLSLLIGFSVQSAHVLLQARTLVGMSRREHRRAMGETALGVGVWVTLALLIGGWAFLFAFVLPLVVANVLVMSFILTNHSLSPLTEVNDPLLNSLSVTVPRLFNWITLGFGFHVEHHLFPSMSSRYAPRLRQLILARWPERYQSMPFFRALAQLFRTPRVYREPTILIDPRDGREWPTLAPGSGGSSCRSLSPAAGRKLGGDYGCVSVVDVSTGAKTWRSPSTGIESTTASPTD